jgi:WD40 repeat protein
MARTLALLGISSAVSYSRAFTPSSSSTTSTKWVSVQQQHPRRKNGPLLQSIFFDDFEDFSDFAPNTNDNDNAADNFGQVPSFSDSDLFASLRARQDSLRQEQRVVEQQLKEAEKGDLVERERVSHNWSEANCLSTVRLTIDDYIRRLSVDLYPLVVCGSSRGNLYLGNLEDGEEMDCLEGVHSQDIHEDIPNDEAEACIQALYDGYDGNGPFAVAVKKDLVVSSGREGGINACSIVGEEVDVASGSRGGIARQTKLRLQREGTFRGLEGTSDDDGKTFPPPIITSLEFDDRGTLWAGGYDGKLRGYKHEELDLDGRPVMLRQKRPKFDIDVGAPILDLNVVDDTGIIVVTTHTKGVFLFSLHDGRFLMECNPFASSRDTKTADLKQFARSAMIVRNDNSTTATLSDSGALLIIGGSYGHMYQVELSIATDQQDPSRTILAAMDSITKIRPKHMGPVVSMASPSPGLFVTASHDGTMRVWDCAVGEEDEDSDDDIIELSDDTKPKMPKVLYALSGYKVWLGSVFANDRKLVSDGADNTIIVHSFDEDEDAILRSQQEDDEDTDVDGPILG